MPRKARGLQESAFLVCRLQNCEIGARSRTDEGAKNKKRQKREREEADREGGNRREEREESGWEREDRSWEEPGTVWVGG